MFSSKRRNFLSRSTLCSSYNHMELVLRTGRFRRISKEFAQLKGPLPFCSLARCIWCNCKPKCTVKFEPYIAIVRVRLLVSVEDGRGGQLRVYSTYFDILTRVRWVFWFTYTNWWQTTANANAGHRKMLTPIASLTIHGRPSWNSSNSFDGLTVA